MPPQTKCGGWYTVCWNHLVSVYMSDCLYAPVCEHDFIHFIYKMKMFTSSNHIGKKIQVNILRNYLNYELKLVFKISQCLRCIKEQYSLKVKGGSRNFSRV